MGKARIKISYYYYYYYLENFLSDDFLKYRYHFIAINTWVCNIAENLSFS